MIFVFTGTNNSMFAAKQIAAKTGDDIYSINDALKTGVMPELNTDEKMILVTPTYAWRIPLVVEEWVKRNKFDGAKKLWFVMTCGGEVGNAGKYNAALAKEIGMEYMGTAGINMPDNYIIMFKPIAQDKAEEIYKKSFAKLNTVANQIKAGRQLLQTGGNPVDKLKSSFVNDVFVKKLSADEYCASDACTSCGKCVNLCPLNNIQLVGDKPVWSQNCTHCMACISYCPTQAIEFGSKTVGKRRYTFESYLEK